MKISSEIVYKAKGCEECNYIGYRGRSLISQVILIDEDIRNHIYQESTVKQISDAARKKGTLTLLESGIKRVEEGLTSLEEVMSIAAV